MQGHGRIIAHDFCIAHREANSGLSTLNRTKSILSIYHQQRQLQKQRGMCLNDTYPFCQQPLSGNCHSICFSKPVLWTATSRQLLSYSRTALQDPSPSTSTPRPPSSRRRRPPPSGGPSSPPWAAPSPTGGPVSAAPPPVPEPEYPPERGPRPRSAP